MIQGRLLGAILLVSGTTIGAAMLALPVASGSSGFFPSCFAMGACWLFMYIAALLLLEVCLAHPEDSNLVTLARDTLGKSGACIAVVSYLFLLYALNTAYLDALSDLFERLFTVLYGIKSSKIFSCIPLVLLFSSLFMVGVRALDQLNRVLMAGLISGFALLVFVALPQLDIGRLFQVQSGYLLSSLPIVVTAFGFHVIIPSLVGYLDRDEKLLKKALFWGSIIPLVAYVLWQAACLGTIPLTGEGSIAWGYSQDMNGALLLASQTKSTLVAFGSDFFSLCAIFTSFLGVSLSLFDFVKDGVKKYEWAHSRALLLALTFLPPLIFVLSNPRAFYVALDLAGTYGVVVLLALLPAIMLWIKRYHLGDFRFKMIDISRRGLVIFILLCSLFVLIEAYV